MKYQTFNEVTPRVTHICIQQFLERLPEKKSVKVHTVP